MDRLMEADLYELISAHFHDVIWFRNIDGICEYVSSSVTGVLGYEPRELQGTTISQYVHPDDIENLTVSMEKLRHSEDVDLITCRIRHKNGRYLSFENKLTAIRNRDGELVRVVEISLDITYLKRIENRIAISERFAQLGTWERDVLKNTVYWSEEMYRIFGLEPTGTLPLGAWLSKVHPDDFERVQTAINRANIGKPYDVQFRIIRPSGEIRFVHSQGELIFEGGVVTTIRGSLQDITERKQAEDELLKSKENLKLAQRIAHLGHWDWDVIRNDVYWSDEAYRIFRLSPDDRSDFTLAGLFDFVHPDDADFVKHSVGRALQGESFDIEFHVILPGQSNRIVHLIGETEFDVAGRPIRLFGTVQDITVQRQTEDLLRTSEKLAMAGQLAAGIAHEIRNPLTVLKGFIKLIQTSPPASSEQYFGIVESELNRIQSIVSELLIFSKPESAVVFQQRDLQVILQEVITFLSTEAIMKNVLMEFDCQQRLPLVTCEPNQLKQVFINLSKNAIEAMPNGGKLFIKLAANKNSLLVQFIDEGSGIPVDKIPRLGEPFFTTKEGGTGLGLMVSQKIMVDHRGTIDFSSEVGKGTTVTISLPATPFA